MARGTKRLRRKRWKRRLSALSFGVLLCLALTECSVRLVWTRIVKKWEKPLIAGSSASLGRALIEESLRGPGDSLRIAGAFDPLYRWDPLENLRHKENVTIEARPLQGTPVTFRVTTDEHGLRGPQAPAASGALKVLCLGDSMTFGQGVNDDESYPSQLQIALSKSLGRPVRVFNAGVISHGQREQISVAKRLVPILEPDLVLIQFTIANDVMDDQRWQDAPNAKGELARRPNPCGNLNHHLALTNPLARWSRAYRLGVWRWGRHVIRYRYMVEDDNIELAARQTLELREVCRDASGKAIPTGILLAPSVLQVEGGLAETLLRTIRINEGIAARMKAAEVPCLDLLGGLQAANSAGESLFIPVDRHWNAAGNRVVGVEAARFCQEQLVPK
ncbi:MAG: hypothetical protein JKY65_32350 [Planctomycetes bacterium]|nr:hypothetical protein [Planctomycetota bacterium]